MAVSLLATAPAWAVDWQFNPYVSEQLSVSNTSGQGGGSGSDNGDGLAARTTVGTNTRATGRRLKLTADAALAMVNRTDGRTVDLEQNLHGLSTLELVPNRFLVDANLSSTRELVSTTSPVSGAGAGTDNNNRTSVTSVSISPYWQQRYGRWAQSLARYRHTEVIGSGGDSNDSRNDSVELQLVAGHKLQPWRPALTGEWTNIDERGSAGSTPNDLTRYSLAFSNQLGLSRRYSLTGSIGYDNVDAPTQTRDLSGISWSIGAIGRPGPRSSFDLSFGQRYGEWAVNGTASYALTSHLSMRLSAKQSLGTGLQDFVNDSNLVTVDPITGELVTPGGTPVGFLDRGIDNQISVSQSVETSLIGDYGRNRITVSSYVERRNFDVGNEDLVRVRGVVTRRLSPDLSATLASFYRYTKPTIEATSHTVNARFDLNYRLGRRTTVFAGYSYTTRRSSDTTLEYDEHVASVGGRISF
ncbi:MAG: TIGR03016 family PEP-CTERM system-associated outer membrane protein [Alphaproteobacteria bacterium]|nr:TIGR03016 family PEP-CTERM system-associated outer membrane protein [Alphaproteobacteria bacterium]MCB9929194.1 TIGR03016 family PEP-CTERM system-associated outer membrane protein [Alphaproteobacteria bacterium]